MMSWNSKLRKTLESAIGASQAEYYKVGFEQVRIIAAPHLRLLFTEVLSWLTKHRI